MEARARPVLKRVGFDGPLTRAGGDPLRVALPPGGLLDRRQHDDPAGRAHRRRRARSDADLDWRGYATDHRRRGYRLGLQSRAGRSAGGQGCWPPRPSGRTSRWSPGSRGTGPGASGAPAAARPARASGSGGCGSRPRLLALRSRPCRGATSRRSTPWRRSAGRFCVNVLASHQEDISRRFSARGVDRFEGLALDHRPGGLGLRDAVAWIDCELVAEHEAGDHTIAVARVLAMEASVCARPLVFFRGGYGTFA